MGLRCPCMLITCTCICTIIHVWCRAVRKGGGLKTETLYNQTSRESGMVLFDKKR